MNIKKQCVIALAMLPFLGCKKDKIDQSNSINNEGSQPKVELMSKISSIKQLNSGYKSAEVVFSYEGGRLSAVRYLSYSPEGEVTKDYTHPIKYKFEQSNLKEIEIGEGSDSSEAGRSGLISLSDGKASVLRESESDVNKFVYSDYRYDQAGHLLSYRMEGFNDYSISWDRGLLIRNKALSDQRVERESTFEYSDIANEVYPDLNYSLNVANPKEYLSDYFGLRSRTFVKAKEVRMANTVNKYRYEYSLDAKKRPTQIVEYFTQNGNTFSPYTYQIEYLP